MRSVLLIFTGKHSDAPLQNADFVSLWKLDSYDDIMLFFLFVFWQGQTIAIYQDGEKHIKP